MLGGLANGGLKWALLREREMAERLIKRERDGRETDKMRGGDEMEGGNCVIMSLCKQERVSKNKC